MGEEYTAYKSFQASNQESDSYFSALEWDNGMSGNILELTSAYQYDFGFGRGEAMSVFSRPYPGSAPAEPAGARERHRDLTWRRVWYEFSQHTTIHGVYRITGQTPFKLRRLIWLLLVLTGAGLFIYQVVERIVYYRSWPVTVNVKVNYNKTLIFPTVTICNQNSFRVTEVARQGRYELITNMFSRDLTLFDYSHHNAGNMSLLDLYEMAAHRKEDMIVSCWWNNKECSADDFVTVMTDHGVCFTFNDRKSALQRPLEVSHTGADRGLKLRLNVEQYEYMRGPHDAAGLKILIHDKNEIPFVRDLGEAVPTGSHAFAGVQILQVKNLEPPYGECQKDKTLQYYDFYSVSACKSACRTRHVVARCGCRDIYMPELHPGSPPICTLEAYVTCLLPELERIHREEDSCTSCPVPCDITHYGTTLTYSSTSALNANYRLHRNSTQRLRAQFHHARETYQRVDQSIVAEEEERMAILQIHMAAVEAILGNIIKATTGAKERLQGFMSNILPRIYFHWRWGLDRVKFTIDNDYVRGWEVIDERTFMHACTGYNQISAMFQHMVSQSMAHARLNDSSFRKALYVSSDRDLGIKELLIRRSRDNLTSLHDAFSDATPIYTFKTTPERYFDRFYWLSPKLKEMLRGKADENNFFTKWDGYLENHIEVIGTLRAMAEEILVNQTYDQELYSKSVWLFEKRCRNFLYYRYMYFTRVVNKPSDLAQNDIDEFLSLNASLTKDAAEISLALDNIEKLLAEFRTEVWQHIVQTTQLGRDYLTDLNVTKTTVATHFTNKEMNENLRATNTFFKDMRTRGYMLRDAWEHFRKSYTDIWQSMLSEGSLELLYGALKAEVATIQNDSDHRAGILRKVLPDMMGVSVEEYMSMGQREMALRTNADFPDLDLMSVLYNISVEFTDTIRHTNIVQIVGGEADLFLDVMEDTQTRYTEFLDSLRMNMDYFRENFLQLNVYMKELSYEEIEQQPAYNVIALLSDVGGSMGLFVGASFVTLFEIFDVVIHTLFRRHCTKPRHQVDKDMTSHRAHAYQIDGRKHER